MKKILLTILTVCIIFCVVCISQNKNHKKVFKIKSPNEVFIDFNGNLIFDETEPFKIANLYYIEKDADLSDFDILKNLSTEDKFFLNYYENIIAKRALQNKFVKIHNNDILIDNKSYRKILLDSGMFFDDSKESQLKLINTIKRINYDDYVIYNIKSKKYHKITCPIGRSSKLYKIQKADNILPSAQPCKQCILPDKKHIEFNRGKNFSNEVKSSFYKEPIKIFFLNLNDILKPSNECITEACMALKNEIDSAKFSIDFAIYGINNQPEIFNSLVNAQNRGVKIRWILDYDKQNENYYKDSIELKKVITDFNTDETYEHTHSSSIMHNKFFIFDEQKVWTGSSNITDTDLTGFNANYSVLINSKELANIYQKEFDNMYLGKFHTLKTPLERQNVILENDIEIRVLFSPQDKIITTSIIPMILKAEKYIYIPVFYITNYNLIPALTQAAKKGVDIRIITDATNSHNKYSIHKILRKEGIKVKTENYAGKMHMKALIVDDKYAIIGSMNLTKSGENKNDENVLIIYDEDITKYLKETFLYLWEKIPSKYLNFDPLAESLESIGSCFDNIDNDFDGKTDEEDEGCFSR